METGNLTKTYCENESDFVQGRFVRDDYALISGSSSGLGKSISEKLAGMGYNLILVAYPDALLEDTASDLRANFGVDVKTIAIDLSRKKSCEKVFRKVKSLDINLSILVNNVGIGDVSFFDQTSIAFNRKLVRLNCLVMVELTHLLLPLLRKRRPAFVMNIGSLASLFPVPYKAVYSASKHFVKAFSYALREELREEGIHFTAVFPGAMLTNPEVIKRVNSFGRMARLCAYSSDWVADISVKSMLRKRRLVYPGLMNKLYIFSRYFLGYRKIMKLVKKGMHKEAVIDKAFKLKAKTTFKIMPSANFNL